MYCINCGVELSDTETKCPLCNTRVYHPDIPMREVAPLYPQKRFPKAKSARKALSGGLIIVFFIPLVLGILSNYMMEKKLDWSLILSGALILTYLFFALPLWFKKPNPVIFLPCDVFATALFLHYICYATGGNWFWTFALPITVGYGLIVCSLVTLLRYIKKGKLYIIGGTAIALGAMIFSVELLLDYTFGVDFLGWSVYPMAILLLGGLLLVYLAINRNAREAIARKLFF